MSPEALAAALALAPHPEGGWFRETYRSPLTVPTPRGPRSACTSIYFLLTAASFSAFHRIASDELWHFYRGDALEIVTLSAAGPARTRLSGESPQAMVPAGTWFASHVPAPGSYALVGCTVAPGFDFADFELASRSDLLATYPDHADLITSLTRA